MTAGAPDSTCPGGFLRAATLELKETALAKSSRRCLHQRTIDAARPTAINSQSLTEIAHKPLSSILSSRPS
jgi:hypothetical protein